MLPTVRSITAGSLQVVELRGVLLREPGQAY
jgi:hypothetical protein